MIFHIDAALFTSTPANLIQHQRTSEVPLHHHLEMFVHQCASPLHRAQSNYTLPLYKTSSNSQEV